MGYRNAYFEKMAFTTITMTGINVEGGIQNLIFNVFTSNKMIYFKT